MKFYLTDINMYQGVSKTVYDNLDAPLGHLYMAGMNKTFKFRYFLFLSHLQERPAVGTAMVTYMVL